MKFIIDYIVESKPSISDNQNLAYYSWLLQFRKMELGYFEIYEIGKDGMTFINGCDLAISVIRSQSEFCAKYQLMPLFPNFSQMVVISKGVYEGKDLEGIRYDSPDHMSGWWLITDDYDDNIESLMTVHYHHVAFKRPEILPFLALPFGYRFLKEGDTVEVSKDENE